MLYWQSIFCPNNTFDVSSRERIYIIHEAIEIVHTNWFLINQIFFTMPKDHADEI